MPRKPINPNTINWTTVETTLDSGKSNFKTLGKLTGVSASTIRRLMLSRYGTQITLKRGRAVGGVTWNTQPRSQPKATTQEDSGTAPAAADGGDGGQSNGNA